MIQAGIGYNKVWGNHGRLPSQWDVTWAMSGRDSEGELEMCEEDQLEDCDVDDPELNAIRMRVREMEEEAERLKGLSGSGEEQMLVVNPKAGPSLPMTAEEKKEADRRSVYVGNVDYGGTAQDLEAHFSGCGSINRITILCDKFSGHPKGYAYIEFAERHSVEAAIAMDETIFRGRTIKVLPKRTNMPGISSTDRGGFRGRPRGHRGNFQRGMRPRGRAFRGRGRTGPWNNPY
ncbi:embryonic polyadenylate-binding protein 2 [Discoglossus pictus]